MTVYVDPLNNWGWKLNGRITESCHLFTSSSDLEELHKIAQRIGMRRDWFQNNPLHPHYDLTPARRAAAILAGAQEVNFREAVMIMRARRETVGETVVEVNHGI